jgi:large repetitive protein
MYMHEIGRPAARWRSLRTSTRPFGRLLGRRLTFAARCLAAVLCGFVALGAAQARADYCSSYPDGILDGYAGTPAPSQLYIDRNCTIRNYPADNPFKTNISFYTSPGQNNERWLVIFDNVVHTGQMSCNAVAGHHIWFTNGSSTGIHANCQNLLIPVEKIDKQNPAGQTTAAIGVPFTYTLTSPVLYSPSTGTVINYAGSVNDLHSITIVDDLNATGVALTYIGHQIYWKDTGDPVPHTFSNVGGVLTFTNFPVVPAGRQMIIEIEVVLDTDPSLNVVGKQFINTAKWDFGRLIDGVFYQPLPGEWGISPPLTIGGPDLTVTKTGPATLGRTLNLGEWGQFALDVHNAGSSDAWNVTLIDRLPDGPTGGMCNQTPEILSAQVFQANGTTPAPGKGPLVAGTDYSLNYAGAPGCQLTLTALTPAATIGPDEHLIITYRTQLDADSADGAQLTNVAGATQWFNGDSSNLSRVSFVHTLTDGTPGVLDFQDAHTVTVALHGYFFEKTVQDLTSGANPATTAAPGDRLRYTLRLQTTDGAVNDVSFRDDMGALNASAVFVPGSLQVVGALPAGATNNSNASGGTNSAGVLDIRHLSLPAAGTVTIQFDITLASALLDATQVTNQAQLMGASKLADSDDPTVNGQADPNVAGDEDPTVVVIQGVQPPALAKAITQPTAGIGDEFRYRITVPSTPHSAPLYDVRILDDLSASAADMTFVSVTKVSGPGSWTPINSGTSTSLVIQGSGGGIDIPAGQQVVLDVTVRLLNTSTNVAGLTFTNTASYTYDQLDNDGATQRPGDPGVSGPMTIVEPDLTLVKSGTPQMRTGLPGDFRLDVHNAGGAPAFAPTLTDRLPNTANGGMCDAAPTQVVARIFEADGVTPVGAALTQGSDYTLAFAGDPTCTLTLTMLTTAASIGPDQHLIVTYQALLDNGSQQDTPLTNVAGVTDWYSTATANPDRRHYTRTVTDGTPGVLDHQDAFTTIVFAGQLLFEKTVVDVTSGADPATVATPGDLLRYQLRIENVGATDVDGFEVVDELDRLNSVASFQPGTLSVVTTPAGANAGATDPNGGAKGTGVLHITGLSVPVGAYLVIEFEVQLAPVLANASYVTNQSQIVRGGYPLADSDDPNVNGQADPLISGDEDPTRVQIQSAPYFEIKKISAYLDGDPAVLLAGERLRYTITVKNVGNDNASDARLTDAVPANTAYIAGSTTLNGSPVADGAGGLSPLANGIALSAPENPTPGAMRADASATTANVATITFDVRVDPTVADGTVISNQGFVSAIGGGVANAPSDDPRTPVANDPTRDVVGNLPLLYAEKAAVLQVDNGSPGIVDPGDYLRYTIQVHNNGNVPATMVRLTDDVPNDTTYVADTLTLNGLPVGQPDNGVFSMAAGIWISSSDLTPPVPGPNDGTLSPHETAIIQFDVRVNDATPRGTLLVNQATVTTAEVPTLLTDGDGNPATGPEPTVVVVGDAQVLTITKQVAVVGGGPAVAGATLEYLVTVNNPSSVPAYDAYITDDLDENAPAYLLYVDQSALLSGTPDGVTVAGSVITANYGAQYGALAPGQSFQLRFRAQLNPNLAIGTTVTNTGHVTWNTDQTTAASVSLDVGGMVGSGTLNGTVWHDANFNDVLDPNERVLSGWTVELRRNNQLMATATSAADGTYRISGVVPNYQTQDKYDLTFRAPGAGANTALLGLASSDFSNALQRIYDIEVRSGSNLQNLDLPIDPDGVVYDSISRLPLAGFTLTLVDAATDAAMPAGCFDDPNQQGQITRSDGYYKFDINFSDPSCQSGASYRIDVTPPGAGYETGYSRVIPPRSDASQPPFDVPTCPAGPNDAVPTTSTFCEMQTSELAPPTSVAAQSPGTAYAVYLRLDDSRVPGSSQLFNNHIPVDPILTGVVTITKTTPMVDVTRGQMVPYTITVRNTWQFPLTDVEVIDRYPVGFKYIEGSARFDDQPLEPTSANGQLLWQGLTLAPDGEHTIKLLLAPGAGVTEGKFTNYAGVQHNVTGQALSGEASATVRVVPDPTFDCTDVTGKVFDDANRNGLQDEGETGIAGARLVSPMGIAALTDEYGRFHIACAITPREGRGSNYMLKLDDRTLPSGYRPSTDAFQIKRATRGKALHFSFGASINRVIGLDVADAVFMPDSTEMRPQWRPRVGLLLEELQKGPAVLRLSYLADVEDPNLVEKRVDAMTKLISDAWAEQHSYRLVVEHEVFWRTGKPPSEDPRLSAMRGGAKQ